MARKHNPSEINLKIDGVYPYSNERYEGLQISWTSDIGFGMYNIYKAHGTSEWKADSEYMDYGEEKAFLTELMRLFVEQINVLE